MKALTLALLLSLPSAKTPQKPLREPSLPSAKRVLGGGRWYFAASGHAIYCYGPVMTIPDENGNLEKVATFCRDGSAVVPLFESPTLSKPDPHQGKAKEPPARRRDPQM